MQRHPLNNSHCRKAAAQQAFWLHALSDDGTKEVRQRISDAKDSGDKTTFSKWNS